VGQRTDNLLFLVGQAGTRMLVMRWDREQIHFYF